MGINDGNGNVPGYYHHGYVRGTPVITAEEHEVYSVQVQTWVWKLGGELENMGMPEPHLPEDLA